MRKLNKLEGTGWVGKFKMNVRKPGERLLI